MSTKVAWRKGSNFSHLDPEKVKVELDKIRQRNSGKLNTHEVLAAAELDNNLEIFKAFEWSDKVAGEKWRLHQCRLLCNGLVEVEVDDQPEQTRKRTLVSVVLEDNGRTYLPREIAIADHSEQLATRALNELRNWLRNYEDVPSLRDAVELVKKAIL